MEGLILTSTSTKDKDSGEGLRVMRLLMVISSLSPLFILWAVRGISLIPDKYFVIICMMFVICPYAALYIKIRIGKGNKEISSLHVGSTDNNHDHIFTYLFAMLFPFYREEIETFRDLAATLIALLFIIYLFFWLNLHYINILFALLGYRVFTIRPRKDGNKFSGKANSILITRRRFLIPNEEIRAYRLSNTVYMEKSSDA